MPPPRVSITCVVAGALKLALGAFAILADKRAVELLRTFAALVAEPKDFKMPIVAGAGFGLSGAVLAAYGVWGLHVGLTSPPSVALSSVASEFALAAAIAAVGVVREEPFFFLLAAVPLALFVGAVAEYVVTENARRADDAAKPKSG